MKWWKKWWKRLFRGKERVSEGPLPPLHKLAKLHRAAAIVHGLQLVATAVLAGVLNERYDQKIRFKDNELFTMPVTALIPVFFAITTLGHVYTWWRVNMPKRLASFRAQARWIEYAFSASIMSLAIALLCRIDDIVLLGIVFVSTFIVMLTGNVVERDIARIALGKSVYTNEDAEEDKKPSALFWAASLLEILTWAMIFLYYFDAVREVPGFVHGVMAVLFICYMAYPVLIVLYQTKVVHTRLHSGSRDVVLEPEPEDESMGLIKRTQMIVNYEWVEARYVILSFIAKTSLGWLVFFGSIREETE